MKLIRPTCLTVLAFIATALPLLAQQGPEPPEQIAVPLTDPARPAKVSITLVQGSITVKGSSRRDVLVIGRGRSEASRRRDTGPSTGLRRLNQTAGFRVEENRNEVSIESSSINRGIDFEIQVPSRTNLVLSTVNGGDIVVEAVDGEMEISNVNGSITLTRVAGSVVANTVNGKLIASLTRLTEQKPMAFTSLNGNVDVTFPASLKANLKLRSDMGDVFTDFEMQLRASPAPTVEDNRRNGGRFQVEINKAIYGAVNGGGPEIELRTFNGSVYVRKGA